MAYAASLRREILAHVIAAPGKNRKATNLIMAQRGGRGLAPETSGGTCNAARVNEWLEKTLVPALKKPSVAVMDNAPFHKKKEIAAILKRNGRVLLPLPPYSPDFNPIENSFGVIKRKRQFAPARYARHRHRQIVRLLLGVNIGFTVTVALL